MKKTIKNVALVIACIFYGVFFLQGCVSSQDRFRGETAVPDQIYMIPDADYSGVWRLTDLSVYYNYTPSGSDRFNLSGYLTIARNITNTYPKLLRLNMLISFLDKNGTVLETANMTPPYSVNMIPPEKLNFKLNTALPAGATSFCFSYTGELKGDKEMMNSRHISYTPFS